MSRIGKNPIKLPDTVTFSVKGKLATIKGKLGELTYEIPELIECTQENSALLLKPLSDSKNAQALWGTAARRFMSMIKGVNEGFSLNIELKGVGYRAQVQGNKLVLQLALSHDVEYLLPKGIEVKSAKPTSLTIVGSCKQTVGQVAAEIRSYRKPEPYKGKGIIREGEFVFRKEGKKK